MREQQRVTKRSDEIDKMQPSGCSIAFGALVVLAALGAKGGIGTIILIVVICIVAVVVKSYCKRQEIDLLKSDIEKEQLQKRTAMDREGGTVRSISECMRCKCN